MNDTFKKNISDRLIKAIETEKLTTNVVAQILGIRNNYVSLIKNPKTLEKCANNAFNVCQLWVNSGLSLTEYAKKTSNFFFPAPSIVKPNTVKDKQPVSIDEIKEKVDKYKRNKLPEPPISVGKAIETLVNAGFKIGFSIDTINGKDIDTLLSHGCIMKFNITNS